MPNSTTFRPDDNADRPRGRSRPILALVAFIGAFLFTAVGGAFDTDSFLVAAPFIVAALCCTILFLRLLLGELGWSKWIWLGLAVYLCYVAGDEWYLIVVLAGGTLLCSLLIARLVGNFVPLICVVPH